MNQMQSLKLFEIPPKIEFEFLKNFVCKKPTTFLDKLIFFVLKRWYRVKLELETVCKNYVIYEKHFLNWHMCVVFNKKEIKQLKIFATESKQQLFINDHTRIGDKEMLLFLNKIQKTDYRISVQKLYRNAFLRWLTKKPLAFIFKEGPVPQAA